MLNSLTTKVFSKSAFIIWQVYSTLDKLYIYLQKYANKPPCIPLALNAKMSVFSKNKIKGASGKFKNPVAKLFQTVS
jgi:hypothetical protein